MRETEFDQFADEYEATHARNIQVSGEGPAFFAEYKVRDLAGILAPRQVLPLHILDFGAGIGTSVPWFQKYFPLAKVVCLDVSRRSIEVGESRYPGAAQFVHFDGGVLPFADGTFDVAFAACVFHHIDRALHASLLKELHRVLRAGGTLAIFEHNPRNPLTVRAVDRCPFDANAVLLRGRDLLAAFRIAGFIEPALRYRIFFPAFARILRGLERYLTWLPLGAQYYVFGSKRETA